MRCCNFYCRGAGITEEQDTSRHVRLSFANSSGDFGLLVSLGFPLGWLFLVMINTWWTWFFPYRRVILGNDGNGRVALICSCIGTPGNGYGHSLFLLAGPVLF